MTEENKTYRQVHEDIEWMMQYVQPGDVIDHDMIDRQFNYQSRDAKRYRFQVLNDIYVKNGVLEKRGKNKYYYIDTSEDEVDWENADPGNDVDVIYPLGLEEHIRTLHKSVIIVAGVPGAGKTAFLHNFLLRNMNNPMGCVLFNNDMSPEEIRERFDNSGLDIPRPAPFRVFERSNSFVKHPKFLPDGINVVDYLDLNSEVYMIGNEIDELSKGLRRGIAIVGIQKKPGQDTGIGGVFSLKRPKLYLSLDSVKEMGMLQHQLKIVKSRGWRDPKSNPNGLTIRFKLYGGIKFMRL